MVLTILIDMMCVICGKETVMIKNSFFFLFLMTRIIALNIYLTENNIIIIIQL